jgi:hypothetical protein
VASQDTTNLANRMMANRAALMRQVSYYFVFYSFLFLYLLIYIINRLLQMISGTTGRHWEEASTTTLLCAESIPGTIYILYFIFYFKFY